jgi:shikimate dehydrogenase
MHMAAFAALELEGWRYQRLPVPPALLTETARALPGAGFVGASVTIPHKQAALALADHASAAASEIGAANTLSFAPDGAIEAENTDAPGLVAALECALEAGGEARSSLPGLTVLVLGAGGSARAALWGLQRAGVRDLALWNRTHARAEHVARELGGRVLASPEPADVLINCTSVGLEGIGAVDESHALAQLDLTPDRLREYSYVVDLVYGARETPLLAAARRLGARTLDGIEVLVRQGALSFELWTGVAAPLEAMRSGARGDQHARPAP